MIKNVKLCEKQIKERKIMNKLQNVETMEKVNGEVMEYTQRDKELYEDLCQMLIELSLAKY